MHKGVFKVCVVVLLTSIVTACSGPSGLPPAKEGTLLRKIQDRGKLIVGVKYDVPTFGYLNPKTNTLEGFDPAIAREIAAYIFGNPNKVEFKEAVTKDRIPFLKDGTVDVILSTFTINEERLKEVDFSFVYYVSGDRLLVSKDSPIRTVADLDGRKVAVNKGSSSMDRLRAQTKAEIVQVNNTSEALQMVLNRQAEVMTGDDIAMFGVAMSNPGLKIVGPPISIEPLGAGVAKGDPELLEVVNTVIKNLKSSGKWKTIWKAEIGDKLGIATIPDPPQNDWPEGTPITGQQSSDYRSYFGIPTEFLPNANLVLISIGTLQLDGPDTMTMGETAIFTATLSLPSGVVPIEPASFNYKKSGTDMEFSRIFHAHLRGLDFDIEPSQDDQAQVVAVDEKTRWHWQVRAKRPGSRLPLGVSVFAAAVNRLEANAQGNINVTSTEPKYVEVSQMALEGIISNQFVQNIVTSILTSSVLSAIVTYLLNKNIHDRLQKLEMHHAAAVDTPKQASDEATTRLVTKGTKPTRPTEEPK